MSGFAYDGENYDGGDWDVQPATGGYLENEPYDGTHWDRDPAFGQTWVVGNTALRVVDVTLTPTRLTLVVRVRSASARDALARLDDNAGSVTERERANGVTDGLDTAGGSNTFTVRPPTQLRPPRIERDWLVEDVERERASADTKATLATVTLLADQTRSVVDGYADSANANSWSFSFTGGTIITDRVSNINQGATTSLQLILSRRQAELFETVTAATAGSVVSVVPDGQNYSRDTTPNSRQTVTIDGPDDADDPAISDGDYVVAGWSVFGSDGGDLRAEIQISSRFEPQ